MKGKKLKTRMALATVPVGYMKEFPSYTEGINNLCALHPAIKDFWLTSIGMFVRKYLIEGLSDEIAEKEFKNHMENKDSMMVDGKQVPIAKVVARNGHIAVVLWIGFGFGFDSRRKAKKHPMAFVEAWNGHKMHSTDQVKVWSLGWTKLFCYGLIPDSRELEHVVAMHQTAVAQEQIDRKIESEFSEDTTLTTEQGADNGISE
jgi:hypothetical protein